MEKLNIIQIGICHEHAPGKFSTLKKRPDLFNLIGYVDERDFCKTPWQTELLSEKVFSDTRKLSLDEALDYPGLEAVTVEVPNNDLVPVAIKCMEHNLPMHMDKPAGEDLGLCKKLLDGCKAKNLPFQMGFMFRGNPAFRFCIRAIREKLIGEVFAIEADMNFCGGEAYQEYFGKFKGGIMYNLGCHLIDFVAAAMGRPNNVTSYLSSVSGYPDEIHNNCMAVLEYQHALVTLRTCSKGDPGRRTMKISGTDGFITFSPLERFDGKSVEIELALGKEKGAFPKGVHILRFPPQRDRYEVQLQEFVQVIRGTARPSYSYEHDYLVHEMTLAAANYTTWRKN